MHCDEIKIHVHLAEEIMEAILSRLPVKSLLRFRCVSKSWLFLISSERFIEAHRQKRAFSHHRVIFNCEGCVIKQISVQELLNEASSFKPFPNNDQLRFGAPFVGCCNGLLCLFNYREVLCLWNPATDLGGLRPTKYGFGWDETSGASKVFASSTYQELSKSNVYSSKTNSWKTVGPGFFHVHDRSGVFACGMIHWIILMTSEVSSCYIEYFDLESEEFGRIDLPFLPLEFYRRRYKLAEIGGCLHLLCLYVHDQQQPYAAVWVMKESCWLKLFTTPLSFELRYAYFRPVFGGGPNGEILVIVEDNYLFYSFEDDMHVVRAGKNGCSFFDGIVDVESLVSPDFTTAC